MLRLTTILMVAAAFLVALAAFGAGHVALAPGGHVADGPVPPPDPPDCWPFCPSLTDTNALTADGPVPPPDPPDCWPFCPTVDLSSQASMADVNVRMVRGPSLVGSTRQAAIRRPDEWAA